MCFFYPIGILGARGGGVPQGIGAEPAHAVFCPGQLKNLNFQSLLFLTTQNDQAGYVTQVLRSIFFMGIGCVYTVCFCSFSPWAAQKSKFPNLIFLNNIMTTHNDHPSYVQQVLDSVNVFFTGLGCVCVCHLGVHCSW